MCSKKISEKWKIAADARMRKIILSELSEKTNPREDWEEAIYQYAQILQMMLYDELPYSMELYASQIQFLMDNRQGKEKLIDNWHVIKLFNLLTADTYKNLRYTIARYVLLEDRGEYSKFVIYSTETQNAANYILKEFGYDSELVCKIRELEEEEDKKKAENDACQGKKQAIEDDILAQMR